ncbi:MAG: response regulator transcription factor [Rhodospirillales bacterium]|nr:response regulator transcription factor [Rhodospirillales bacterium]
MASERTLFIVDDDEAIRDSLAFFFRTKGIEARSFATAEEFLAALPVDVPGCVIADVRMPGMSGLDLHKKLAGDGYRLPVIVITGHGDVPMAVSALKAGVFDFFEKPFDNEALLESATAALARDDVRRQQDAAAAEIRERAKTLSPREHEVMDLIVAGHPNKIVAAQLGISPRTVEVYRAHVMQKMQARRLSDLVLMSLRLKQADI